jgi:hypothetical protein
MTSLFLRTGAKIQEIYPSLYVLDSFVGILGTRMLGIVEEY